MARSAAPTKLGTMTLKPKTTDERGLINVWDMNWPEAKELDSIVKDGRVDGMTPRQVMDLYPNQFRKFTYRVFASGLNNARKRCKKSLADRETPEDREFFLFAI